MILFLLRFAQGFADKKWQACLALELATIDERRAVSG
jgi:hypothetical protein